MKGIRQRAKLASVFLTILMLSISIPYQSVFAAMIGTEAALDSTKAQKARADINKLLSREDVQSALIAQGIDPEEAKARIDSLSNTEVVQFANQIGKQTRPGGSMTIAPPIGIVVAVLAAIILFVYLFISGVTPPVEVEKKSE